MPGRGGAEIRNAARRGQAKNAAAAATAGQRSSSSTFSMTSAMSSSSSPSSEASSISSSSSSSASLERQPPPPRRRRRPPRSRYRCRARRRRPVELLLNRSRGPRPARLQERLGIEGRAAFRADHGLAQQVVIARAAARTDPLGAPFGLRHAFSSICVGRSVRRAIATAGATLSKANRAARSRPADMGGASRRRNRQPLFRGAAFHGPIASSNPPPAPLAATRPPAPLAGPRPRAGRQVDLASRADAGRARRRPHRDHRAARRRGRAAHRRGDARARAPRSSAQATALAWSTGVGIGGLAEPDDVLDLGNSGTAARLLLGIAGDPSVHRVRHRRRLAAPPADGRG